MVCDKCGTKCAVKDTRHANDETTTMRLYECKKCKHKFYTIEEKVKMNMDFTDMWCEGNRSIKRKTKEGG